MHAPVIMFTGQGSQRIGMGRDLDATPDCRAVWDCASDIGGFDVRQMCWKGPLPRLSETRYQQIAVTAVALAAHRAALDETPALADAVCIGHSVGEYAALHAAGVLNLTDTFRALRARSEGMQAQAGRTDGAMVVVKALPASDVAHRLQAWGLAGAVVVANDNAAHQVVIAGPTADVKAASHRFLEAGHATVRLAVNGAWHSPLMAGMQDEYRLALGRLAFLPARRRVLLNRTASEPEGPASLVGHLVAHLCETVLWRQTIDRLLAEGHREFVEFGPRPVLAALVPATAPNGASVRARHGASPRGGDAPGLAVA